jgi:hypothetical protein
MQMVHTSEEAALKPWRPWLRALIAMAFLGPCLWGFGSKFYELVVVCRGDPNGAFAITPIVNYLLASTGFLLLLGWGAFNGMFRDIEAPKYMMLENEQRLDANETAV